MNRKKNILIVGSNYYEEIYDNLLNESKHIIDQNEMPESNHI